MYTLEEAQRFEIKESIKCFAVVMDEINENGKLSEHTIENIKRISESIRLKYSKIKHHVTP